jgi:plastocyanin
VAGLGDIKDAGRATYVTVRSDRFEPPTIEIAAGDAVTWRNEDPRPHTVSSAQIESGEFGQGEEFVHTFERPGHYRYFCMLHPRSVGEVFVR